MGRGSLQLRHRKGKKPCPAKGKDARRCRCGPTVYAVLAGEWTKIGHLAEGWRKDDLGEFEHQLAEMRRKLSAGEPYRPAEPKLLREWAQEWFNELHDAADAGDISKLTYNTYEGSWHNHLEAAFGDKPIAAITPEMVRRFIRQKIADGLSPRTANATITPLSAMLTDAMDAGLIQSNPCQQPRRARHGASRRRGHSLRHTYASILAADGVREDVVAVLMGHKRGSVTSLYTHLFADAFEGVEQALAAALNVNEASTDGAVTTARQEQPADTDSAGNGMGERVLAS
jgi:Phage integrase family/Phage integrase SAM-like domain